MRGRRVPGEPLLFAAHFGETGAPDIFLPFLIGEELLERGGVDVPPAVYLVASNEFRAGQARRVVGAYARGVGGVARADIDHARDDDCSG